MVSLQDSNLSSSSSSKWFVGRSMRTVRSNLFHPPPENLSDSVIDLRLRQLSAATDSPTDHSFLLLDLDSSTCSSTSSDISAELRRLASATDTREEADSTGFLEQNGFCSEIMSPVALRATVRLCVDSLRLSPSAAVKRAAAERLRLLAKNRAENRAVIGESGAVAALTQVLHDDDACTQEHAVTALLNLSLHDGNREAMSGDPAAVAALVRVLKTGGTETSRQNAACALLNLSLRDEGTRMAIGASGAIPPLVALLVGGSTRGKKDALTALYKLCGPRENKERAVRAGAVGPLVGMVLEELGEKAMVVLSRLAGIEEGREAIVEEGGIAGLVEAVQDSSQKGKEFAVMTLLQLCQPPSDEESESLSSCVRVRNRGLLVREGGIPPLAALSQSGTIKAKHMAETLLRYLREPRQEASTSTSP